MNDEIAKEILSEVKKLSTLAEHYRKLQKRSLIFALILVPILFGGIYYFENQIKSKYTPSETAQENWDWYKVSDDEERGKLNEALEKTQYLISLSPNYYYGYKRLGLIYLAKNELEKAKESFEKAYNILPNESNKENLDAITKRIKKEQGS
jgi:tetratricopeptide (TPR) repeat protein